MKRNYVGSVGLCTCGKQRYPSRRTAKAAARLRHPGDRLAAYRCGPFWHVGHLSETVTRGFLARDDYYRA